MKFNTSTLGYKLTSGKLSESRKHSEQLNKYLAGLIDSDGSFFLYFSKRSTGKYKVFCFFSICQSEEKVLVESLSKYYNLGSTLNFNRGGKLISQWTTASKDTLKLTNRLAKHLRVKGTHLDNLLWLQDELEDVELSEHHLEELREFSKCSRENSKWMKRPKHLSYSWIAGFLDGDGHYRCRRNRRVFDKRFNRFTYHNNLSVSATSAPNDRFILDQLVVDLGGKVNISSGYPKWTMGLGKAYEKRSLDFLKKMRKYSCMLRKYLIVEDMIEFHSNNKQQRLSKLNSKE